MRSKTLRRNLAVVAVLAQFVLFAGNECGTNGTAVCEGFERSALSRFSVRIAPEIRTTYLSLGKIMEDRPMQVTSIRLACDLDDFGKIGIRNWDVSSLTDRRQDAHRRPLYHTEFGPTWEYDLEFSDDWKLHNDFTTSWTLYRGFRNTASNKTYWWVQTEPSLLNPYLVPFCRLRRTMLGNDYLFCRLGLRRKFRIWEGLYLTPEVAIDGGSGHCQNRIFGRLSDGGSVSPGFHSISPRLELGWTFSSHLTVYAWIEQYEVMGNVRAINADYSYRCAHNDWTHGGVGFRASF